MSNNIRANQRVSHYLATTSKQVCFAILILASTVCYVPAVAQGLSEAYRYNWRDPEVESRIAEGIEANRKGWMAITVVDAEGRPVKDAKIEYTQTGHEFRFGANGFMVDGYNTKKKNLGWESAFTRIFNYVTAPFYWRDLEPEKGRLRYGKNSPEIYRRPPPDRVVAFAKRHGLNLKGHTLLWGNPIADTPDWAPDDPKLALRDIEIRIDSIANRYRNDFSNWDVINEVAARGNSLEKTVLPDDYVYETFKIADRLFPEHVELTLNEITEVWFNFDDIGSQFYLLTDQLLGRGADIDVIGFQFHMLGEESTRPVADGEVLMPLQMFRVLDRYADFDLPIHITEVTIPMMPQLGGEDGQAELTRNFYRLWFSHPNVEAITWWNLADGTGFVNDDAGWNENQWDGGLIGEDFSPKKAYQVLDQLINEEWTSRGAAMTDEHGRAKIRGFYGDYAVAISSEGSSQNLALTLTKGGLNKREIVVK